MANEAVFSLEDLRRELARNEHLLSELEVILADYTSERIRLVREISRLQTGLREAEEKGQADRAPRVGRHVGQKGALAE